MTRGRMEDITALVLDDDLRMRQLVSDLLEEEAGIIPFVYDDSREALALIEDRDIQMVITDLKMPHVDGIGILERAKAVNPDTVVIIITGYGTIESAIEAVKKGAYDYIQKPFEPDAFSVIIGRAKQYLRLLRENRRLQRVVDICREDDLVGAGRAISGVKDMIAKIARFSATVLIQGETGTGKELAARLIHRNGNRPREKFLPINCGAVAETLLEAELFGYEKGAFTGAERQKKGLFEAADGGTIFLDEINATSSNFQVKLLRVLQDGSFLRVGGTEPVRVDVRVIVASNANLEKEVEAGRFRRDLFYRMNVITMDLPPLRKRKEDIPSLAYHFLHKYSIKHGKQLGGISPDALTRLTECPWPGNVRELENVIEKAVILEDGDTLRAVHLPKNSGATDVLDVPFGLVKLEDVEKAVIRRALTALQGQKAKVAEALGISTTSLWRKIKRYGIE